MPNEDVVLTTLQRRIYLDALRPGMFDIVYVIDKEHQGETPLVKMQGRTYTVTCTEYMKYNMQRRDDTLQWHSFFDQLNVPRSLPAKKDTEQSDAEWLIMAARAAVVNQLRNIPVTY